MHPPFGVAFYNPRSVAPRSVRTVDLCRGTVPFRLVQPAMVAAQMGAPAADPARAIEIQLQPIVVAN